MTTPGPGAWHRPRTWAASMILGTAWVSKAASPSTSILLLLESRVDEAPLHACEVAVGPQCLP